MTSTTTPSSPSLAQLAEATPDRRNRAVDFLRAVSIFVVAVGHWLMAGIYLDTAGDLHRSGLLDIASWTHPLTWVLQVMPIFFLVGGYANALSWRSARTRGASYGGWLRARLRRLTLPVLPLMLFWVVAAPLASALGMPPYLLRIATSASLVPTWFLAAYVVVVAVAPLSLALWERAGLASVAGLLALAGLVDLVSIGTGSIAIGCLNYLVAWGAVHQLGCAWLDGRLEGAVQKGVLIVVGLAGLWLLTVEGPYAISMVGAAGNEIDNAFPTRVPLAFLGLLQTGVVMTLMPLLQRLLRNRRVWMATIFVNARIMTIYLWHLTALGIVVAIAMALGGWGLHVTPGTAQWWLTRPVWITVMALATAVLVVVMGRFEQPGSDSRSAPAAARPVLAMVFTCGALGVMARFGLNDPATGAVYWHLPLIPVVASFVFGVSAWPSLRRTHAAAIASGHDRGA